MFCAQSTALVPKFIQDLFNPAGSFCYSNFEEKYLQSRFHGNTSILPSTQHPISSSKLSSTSNDEMKQESSHIGHESMPIAKQRRLGDFVRVHNGAKPLLILDVDNTLLFARYFSEEMRINDRVTYFKNEEVTKPNATVTKLHITLTLSVIDERLMSAINIKGAESTEHPVWVSNNKSLKVQ